MKYFFFYIFDEISLSNVTTAICIQLKCSLHAGLRLKEPDFSDFSQTFRDSGVKR